MSAPPNGLLFGLYRALVIDPDDPKQTGRVKVRIPDIMTNKATCGEFCEKGLWARPGNLQLGGRNVRDTLGPRCFYDDALYQGQCLIPPKGSHVFIFFEKGDPNRPFYFGAADYGQNKILAEHRTGGKQYLKWTPMKTHQGRAMIFSDDPFDARVEITGKKRILHNPPDGDFQSVYQIDNNQTIFMIEERPDHEKVMLKDYHGNYMKMIQNDAGRSDQFHLWMKDDIHIETLKNIYITAHENIHIRAYQDIYINALQNMYIKVTEHFSEMAKLIDRYSETDDNLFATNNINQKCGIDFAMQAGSNIKEMSGAVCSRKAGGNLADESAASYSVKAAGTASVVGAGGAMVCGPTTTINNGMAPIPALEGCKTAATTPEATDADPDKERYQEVPDPPKPDPVEDKNELWKCDKNLWKPWKPYVESGITQCINAKVGNTGGCGSSGGSGSTSGGSSGGSGSGGGGGGGSSGSGSGSGTGNSSATGGSRPNGIGSGQPNDSTSSTLYPSTPASVPEQKDFKIPQKKIQVAQELQNIVDNHPVLTEPPGTVEEKGKEAIGTLVDIIQQEVPKVINEINDITDDITDTVKREIEDPVKDVLSMVYTSSKIDKTSKVISGEFKFCLPCFCSLVDFIFRKIVNHKISGSTDKVVFTQDDINQAFSRLTEFKDPDGNIDSTEMMLSYGYLTLMTNYTNIKNNVKNLLDNYVDNSINVNDEIFTNYGTKLESYFEDAVEKCNDSIQIDTKYPDYCKSSVKDGLAEFFRPISDYIKNDFLKDNMSKVFNDTSVTSELINDCKSDIYALLEETTFKNNFRKYLEDNKFTLIGMCNWIANDILKKCNDIDWSFEYELMNSGNRYIHSNDALKDECYIPCNDDKTKNPENPFCGNTPSTPDPITPYNTDSDSKLGPEIEDRIFNKIDDIVEDSIIDPVVPIISELDSTIIGSYPISDSVTDITNVITPDIITPGITSDVFSDPTVIDSIIPDDFHKTFTDIPKDNEPPISPLVKELTSDISSDIIDGIPDPDDISKDIIDNIPTIIPPITIPTSEIENIITNSFDPDEYETIVTENPIEIQLGDGKPKDETDTRPIIDRVLDPFKDTVIDIIETLINEHDDTVYEIQTGIDVPQDTIDEYENNINEFETTIVDKIIGDVTTEVTEIDSNVIDDIKDKFEDNPTQNQLDSVISDIETFMDDKLHDIIDVITSGGDPTEKLDDLSNIDPDDVIDVPNDDGTKDDLIKDLMKFENDILKPIENIGNLTDTTQDFIENELSDVDPIKTYQGQIFSVTNNIIDDIGDSVGDQIITDFKNNNPDIVDKITTELSKDDPDPMVVNDIKTEITSKLEDSLKDPADIINKLENVDIETIINDNVNDVLPTDDKFKDILSDVIGDATKNVIGQIKTAITDNIILTDGVTQDEFNKNVDLTRLYVIPGLIDHTDKNCDHKPLPTDDRYAGYASNPNINGGCGCMYSFLLFLQNRFYEPIYPMLINDGIKTIGFDLNPNMDKYIDTEYLVHSPNIFEDYDNWWKYYTEYKDRPGTQLYFDRIDRVMSDAERYDFTVIVNLLDFAYKGYKFLEKFEEKDRYTVVMWEDPAFKTYLRDTIQHITTKEDANGKRVNRQCLILFNIGNGNYYNLSDPDCEKYPMYPTCKFMRELVMFIAYKCNLSSNYMGITHNKNQDLYYYNPYAEFKTYDDQSRHKLEDYNIEYVDVTADKTVEYDENGDVCGGYFYYLKECGDTKSYPMAFIPCLKPDSVVKPNKMNEMFMPNARKAMRYMYLGHSKYFKYKDLRFDNNGEVE